VPIRALSVDDHQDTAEALARLLQAAGCAATFVTDSAKALDAADAMGAELVFLDLAMPGIDGYELARMFRRRYGETLVLIAVTAHTDEKHRSLSREAGFDAHIKKPIEPDTVHSILATVSSRQL
jgi:DNA-binding response OmpR family regulator